MSMAVSQVFRLLSLPRELQAMIYRLVLGNVKILLPYPRFVCTIPVEPENSGFLPCDPAYTALLSVCSQVRAQVQPLVWAHSQFTARDVNLLPYIRGLMGKPMEGIRTLHLHADRFYMAPDISLLSSLPNLKLLIMNLHPTDRAVWVESMEALLKDEWNTDDFNGLKGTILSSRHIASDIEPLAVEFMESVIIGRPDVEVLFAQKVVMRAPMDVSVELVTVHLEMEFGFTRLEDGILGFTNHKIRERTSIHFRTTERSFSVG